MRENQPPRSAGVKAFLIAITLLFVVALGYVGLQLYTILHRTYRTETAIAYTMADSISLSGMAVFETVDVPGEGNLGYIVADGERVSAGTVLAERYTDESQGVLRERLDRLDRTLELLSKSQNSTGSDLSMLTTQTRTALYNLLDQVDTASYSGIAQAEEDFLLAQNRLQISTGQADNFESVMATLQQEREEVAGQLGGLQTITAATNGYFVSSVSANPISMDQETLDAMSSAELRSLLEQGAETSPAGLAGHIITGFSWRFYGVCSLETAARLDGITKVNISVPGKENDPLPATVVEVTEDEETGTAKVVIECRSINANVLRFGIEEAQVDLTTYEGIRIDRRALHIKDGAKGVYVKYGDLQRFRRITILYEDENYILVPKDGALGTENEVRLYDEVIVEGTNLQDGKLL
ncbi:MAG: HlyD family efflux transporter periplasmic adaptor subunit [Gemmiger sp.]|uniref:HlyD family efflux transporter periplasmic adaptor subunit n=1 Tax=Gemmiger sp. TaxID=2049027 RepID=UPI002A909B3B|nr:HlyD family efflux transporter periplasmic adaptor subunit [Gemmiger sp.]MDY5326666.1 HlyD family efflux transporter periplasmic adaptor subunit [Gemmiger sp.]